MTIKNQIRTIIICNQNILDKLKLETLSFMNPQYILAQLKRYVLILEKDSKLNLTQIFCWVLLKELILETKLSYR